MPLVSWLGGEGVVVVMGGENGWREWVERMGWYRGLYIGGEWGWDGWGWKVGGGGGGDGGAAWRGVAALVVLVVLTVQGLVGGC